MLWFFKDTTLVNVNECVWVHRWVNDSHRSTSEIAVRSGWLTLRWKIFTHKIMAKHKMAVLSCIRINTIILVFFIDFILSQTSFFSINVFLTSIPVFTHLFLSLKQFKASNKLHCTIWQQLLQQKFLLNNIVCSDQLK